MYQMEGLPRHSRGHFGMAPCDRANEASYDDNAYGGVDQASYSVFNEVSNFDCISGDLGLIGGYLIIKGVLRSADMVASGWKRCLSFRLFLGGSDVESLLLRTTGSSQLMLTVVVRTTLMPHMRPAFVAIYPAPTIHLVRLARREPLYIPLNSNPPHSHNLTPQTRPPQNHQTLLTPLITASNLSNTTSLSLTALFLSSSASLNSRSSTRNRSSCARSDVPMPGSVAIRYSICCSLSTRSRASSRCAAANVRGESGVVPTLSGGVGWGWVSVEVEVEVGRGRVGCEGWWVVM